MNITPRQFEAIVAVADTGSFTLAASRLSVSQPTLSDIVARTEAELGLKLFERTTRSLSMTADAAQIIEVAREALERYRSALEEIADRAEGRNGRVTVALLPSVAYAALPDALVVFRKRYPSIRISIRDAHHDQAVEAVRSGVADIGVTMRPPADSGLLYEEIGRDVFVAVGSPATPWLTEESISWRALGQASFIAICHGSSVRRITDHTFETAGVSIRPAIEAASVSSAMALARAGLGITALPALALSMFEKGAAVSRPLVEQPVTRGLGIIMRRGNTGPPFLQYMKKCLGTALKASLR
jgi:DNA-binding transcriptional LysR family regulator